MQISDRELIQRCKRGDRDAFGVLIKRYQHAVYGLCYHFSGDFADAQDLAQETFVRVFLDLHQIQRISKFPAWLRQVATNICRMWLRKQRRRPIAGIDAATESDLTDRRSPSPADEAVSNEMRGFVEQCVRRATGGHQRARVRIPPAFPADEPIIPDGR